MVGIVILIVGVIAIIYANYQNGRIAHAEGSIRREKASFLEVPAEWATPLAEPWRAKSLPTKHR